MSAYLDLDDCTAGNPQAAAELGFLCEDLKVKQILLDEAIRKGLQLCQQNGELFMQIHDLQAQVDGWKNTAKTAYKRVMELSAALSTESEEK